MKELESYCGTMMIPYMPMWNITIHVVAFLVNQYIPAWIILLGDPLSSSKCQHGQCRTLKVEYYPYGIYEKYFISDTRNFPNHVYN